MKLILKVGKLSQTRDETLVRPSTPPPTIGAQIVHSCRPSLHLCFARGDPYEKSQICHLILQLHCLQELKLKGSKFVEYQNIVMVSPFFVSFYIVIFNHVQRHKMDLKWI
jgi:hypothetical protein